MNKFIKQSNIKKSGLFLLLSLLLPQTVLAFTDKILIITYSYNEPSFIELQEKTFQKFLREPYEFLVINDASTDVMAKEIFTTCNKLGLTCLRFPQAMHSAQTPNDRHSDCIKYSLEKRGFDHDGIVMMVDSDMFLIKDFCTQDYLQGYDIAGCVQERSHVRYISPGFALVNMVSTPNKREIDFTPGRIEGHPVDTGGHMHVYFKNNPSVRIKTFNTLAVKTLPKDPLQLKQLGYDDFFIFYLEKGLCNMELYTEYFLHYYAGTNWPGFSNALQQQKKYAIFGLINDLTR